MGKNKNTLIMLGMTAGAAGYFLGAAEVHAQEGLHGTASGERLIAMFFIVAGLSVTGTYNALVRGDIDWK